MKLQLTEDQSTTLHRLVQSYEEVRSGKREGVMWITTPDGPNFEMLLGFVDRGWFSRVEDIPFSEIGIRMSIRAKADPGSVVLEELIKVLGPERVLGAIPTAAFQLTPSGYEALKDLEWYEG